MVRIITAMRNLIDRHLNLLNDEALAIVYATTRRLAALDECCLPVTATARVPIPLRQLSIRGDVT